MTPNGNQPAYPTQGGIDVPELGGHTIADPLNPREAKIIPPSPGLTKREAFAMAAMQGWCAAKVSVNGKPLEGNEEHAAGLAEVAVIYADALLAELERTSKP